MLSVSMYFQYFQLIWLYCNVELWRVLIQIYLTIDHNSPLIRTRMQVIYYAFGHTFQWVTGALVSEACGYRAIWHTRLEHWLVELDWLLSYKMLFCLLNVLFYEVNEPIMWELIYDGEI